MALLNMLNTIFAILAVTQTKAPASIYTQSTTTAKGIVEMRTSAQQLTREGKPDIWLIGAVHVGSKDYYSSLQKLLDGQEVVLFEGVKSSANPAPAPKPDSKPAKNEATDKPVYKALSDALGLEFQLNAIKYDRPNWKNVDLTWEQMDKINKDAGGEKGNGGGYGQIKQILDPKSPQAKAFAQMMDTATPGMKEALKLIIVKSVASGELVMDSATEQIVIKARNKVVIDSLSATIDAANAPKSIAVFYGAKHLPDMEQTLTKDYGYKLGKQQWFLAADADPSKVDATGQMLLDMMEKQKKGGGSGPGLLRK